MDTQTAVSIEALINSFSKLKFSQRYHSPDVLVNRLTTFPATSS